MRPNEPLANLGDAEPDMDKTECRGCGTERWTVTLASIGHSVDILGYDDETNGINLDLCAPCLRALADKLDKIEKIAEKISD